MLRNILCTTILLVIVTVASAKKMILPIEYVAATADMIVMGEIASVENDTYRFNVAATLKGNKQPVITVQQFREWTCDLRYAKAAKGQKLFLFLKNVNGKLEIINGSTGEIPIIDHKVVLANERYNLKDYKSAPYQLSPEEFKAGIKGFIHLFAIAGEHSKNRPVHFLQSGKENELQAFIATGGFARWICEKLQLHYNIVKS